MKDRRDPPTDASGPAAGDIDITNREPETLTFTSRRIDLVPCDGDEPITFGADESVSVALAAKVGLSPRGAV